VFEACYRADALTLMATAAALLLPDANAALDARCEALAGAGGLQHMGTPPHPCMHAAVWVGADWVGPRGILPESDPRDRLTQSVEALRLTLKEFIVCSRCKHMQ